MERELRAVGLTDSIYGSAERAAIDAEAFFAPGAERLAVGIGGDLSATVSRWRPSQSCLVAQSIIAPSFVTSWRGLENKR